MKKFMLLLFTAVTLYNCSNEIEFNSPAFQASKDYQLWRAVGFSASIDSEGALTLTGTTNFETVNLKVPSAMVGTFTVGETSSIEAQFIDVNGVVFSTNNRPDEDVSVYPELGEIIIEEIEGSNDTFTGTFRFLAFDPAGETSVGFSSGIFFKVPRISNPQ
ncbi:MAG: hypothetical protein KJO22_04705 [Bacteroidia bacterium]|nr:hypothetical protein [Winogradskyella sp.]MBT8376146.1 hypothetical protein [Bacteroidia bacterium]NNL81932.1 hypothetical protein [Winogradskyella sp.]